MEKYSWSFNQDCEIWRNSADSIEECLCQAREEADGQETVYIGENIPFVLNVDAEGVLDGLQEQAYDFAGELVEDWEVYERKTMRDELDALSNALTAVVAKWLKSHNREPYFWQVADVKAYELKGIGGKNKCQTTSR